MCGLVTAGRAPAADLPAIDPVWVERAKAEIPLSAQRYKTVAKKLDETVVMKYRGDAGGPKQASPFRNRTLTLSIQCVEENVLFRRVTVYDDAPTKPEITVEVRNPDYSFTLTQRQHDSPYVLTAYNRDSPLGDVGMAGGMSSTAYVGLESRVLAAVNGEPGQKLLLLRWDASKNLLVAAIEVTTGKQGNSTVAKWEYSIDTTNRWRIVQRTVTSPSKVNRVAVNYGSAVGGEPCPNKIVEHSQTTGGISFSIETTLDVREATQSPADFRLSAFGLPEPVDAPPPPRNSRTMWWLIGAGGFALLAFGLRFLTRRKAQVT